MAQAGAIRSSKLMPASSWKTEALSRSASQRMGDRGAVIRAPRRRAFAMCDESHWSSRRPHRKWEVIHPRWRTVSTRLHRGIDGMTNRSSGIWARWRPIMRSMCGRTGYDDGAVFAAQISTGWLFLYSAVIHALVVVAYLLFCSIGFLFLANCHCAQIPCIGHETDDKNGPDLVRRRAT
jgi:hypothetical protein